MSDSTPSYDALVIGAGPAGVAASIVLKQSGLKVAMIDQGKQGKLKVGESVPGAAIRLLNRLGIPDLSALLHPNEFEPCTANASAWATEKWHYQDAIMNPEGGGWHVLRHQFDRRLREKAWAQGVDQVDGVVTAFEWIGNGYEIQLKGEENRIRSKWLVDATGRKRLLSRGVAGGVKKYSNQFAAIAWTKTTKDDKDLTTRVKSVKNGWWYTSKLPQNIRVTAFQTLPEHAATLVKNPSDFFPEFNHSGVLNVELLESHLMEPISAVDASVHFNLKPFGRQHIAVGDAAFSFDPLSSQGIFFALYSGIRGGEVIAKSLHSPEETDQYLNEYQVKVNSVFHSNMRARGLFYSRELRYLEAPYWLTQLKMMKEARSTKTPNLA